jgi:predicted RNA-binding protein with RPS1 domain
VTIVWGLADNDGTDQDALDILYAAARRANRLGVVHVDNTWANMLVSDDYFITTSFNWLSFRGEPSRTYRQDDGDLVQDQALADRAYASYLAEACARALEVVGTLPTQYHDLVHADVTWADSDPVTPHPALPEKKSRQPAAPSQTERRRTALSRLAAGQTVSGPVKTLTAFGAFVDLGGVDGLIHISELAAHRVQHPSEVVSVGETVTVLILDVDTVRHRVSLSLKATTSVGSEPSPPSPEQSTPPTRRRRRE